MLFVGRSSMDKRISSSRNSPSDESAYASCYEMENKIKLFVVLEKQSVETLIKFKINIQANDVLPAMP